MIGLYFLYVRLLPSQHLTIGPWPASLGREFAGRELLERVPPPNRKHSPTEGFAEPFDRIIVCSRNRDSFRFWFLNPKWVYPSIRFLNTSLNR